MIIDPSLLEEREAYKLLSASVVPRPIAWVSSIDEDNVLNLAPFSFFTVVSKNPAMISLTICSDIGGRKGEEKDTLVNIRNQKEFVVNVVTTELGNAMQKTGENFSPNVDEFQVAGLTPIQSEYVKSYRVKESPINMECTLYQIIPMGNDHLVIGKVERIHINEDIYLGNNKVDIIKVNPLGRLAGDYVDVNHRMKIESATYKNK